MNPMKLPEPTRTLAVDQPQYNSLDIQDVTYENGDNVMVSLWYPSNAEKLAIAAGHPVSLHIIGTVHPPVLVSVYDCNHHMPTNLDELIQLGAATLQSDNEDLRMAYETARRQFLLTYQGFAL